jgi:hypothetical protein
LLHWLIAFVKDEGTSLIVMATTLYFIIDCELLNIFKVYEGTCLGMWCLNLGNMLQMMTKSLLG